MNKKYQFWERTLISPITVNLSDYRLYRRYVDHIPSEYRAVKFGYSKMQREWEKGDADFCYAFVSQTILNWQMIQEKPLYEIDMSLFPEIKDELIIAGVSIPNIYQEKRCISYMKDDSTGELLIIDEATKDRLQHIYPGKECLYRSITTNSQNELIRKYEMYIVIDVCEFNLVLNNGSLWEFILCYRRIPFTDVFNSNNEKIDIDYISEFKPQDEIEEKFKRQVIDFGPVNTVDKAFELNGMLDPDVFGSVNAKGVYSSNLIDILDKNDGHKAI